VTHDQRRAEQSVVQEGNRFAPEMMVRACAERAKPGNDFGWGGVETGIGGTAQDTDSAIDRQSASCPTALPVAAEPVVRRFVVGVVRIE